MKDRRREKSFKRFFHSLLHSALSTQHLALLLRFIGIIVPRRLRAEWKQEWEAELQWRERQLEEWDKLDRKNKLALWWYSAGAIADALWLQPKRWEDEMIQDLRFGARMLIKNPGFTLIAIFTLALGIGANTAIFSVVNVVLLRPLPYSDPDRVVFVYNSVSGLNPKAGLMEGEYLRLRDQAMTVERVALYAPTTLTLTGAGEPERIPSGKASGDLFAALGVPLALGRSFKVEEEPQGKGDVVILSHGFWQRKFAADPGIVGQSITLEGQSHTIIGILPQNFKSPLELQSEQAVELWVPPGYFVVNPCCSHYLNVIARLREGQTLAQFQAETTTLTEGVKRDYPGGFPKMWSKRVLVKPLQQEIIGDLRQLLWVLLAAVGCVLLIACVNVANLLLARGEARGPEIAIRAALGAGRARIVRQMLAESLLLAIIGGIAGLALAALGLRLLPALGAEQLPRLQEIRLDYWALGFTLLLTLMTGVIFGLIPALQTVKIDLHTSLKAGGRTAVSRKGRSRLRGALVIAEVALSLVLIISAGLLIKSFWQLQQIETGFRPEQLLTLRLFPPASTYPDDLQVAAFYEKLLDRVRLLPGVTDATAASGIPIGSRNTGTVTQTDEPVVEQAPSKGAEFRVVTPGYFRTLGVRLLRGRLLEESDQEQAAPVAVVNESLARIYWANQDPLGRRIRLLDGPRERAKTAFLTVVGVVADAKNTSLTDAPGEEVYVPLRQRKAAVAGMGFARQMTLAVRTSAEPEQLINSIRREVWGLDRNIPITNVQTMEQILEKVTVKQRFIAILLGIFAAVALTLAGVGIYGVMSYVVSQRTHEIGIRRAMGAQTRDILRLVIADGMTLTIIGVLIGFGGAIALTRLMKSLLFGVTATDPLTMVTVGLLLIGVALLACYLPARRAVKVDPLVALREC
jgi:putative ABC transport system permease protein